MSGSIPDPAVASDERQARLAVHAAQREPRTPAGQSYPAGVPGVPALLRGAERAQAHSPAAQSLARARHL